MKKTILLLLSVVLLSSCSATFKGYTTNATVVNLEQNNFKVIQKVNGSATASYILGFGGNKKDGLISEARSEMMKKANMIGSAKAIANEIVDIKTQLIFGGVIVKYTVTTSADIIEFE